MEAHRHPAGLVVGALLLITTTEAFNFSISDQALQAITGKGFGAARYFFVLNSTKQADVVTLVNSALLLSYVGGGSRESRVSLEWSRREQNDATMLSWSVTSDNAAIDALLSDELLDRPLENPVLLNKTHGGIAIDVQCSYGAATIGSSTQEGTVGVYFTFTVAQHVGDGVGRGGGVSALPTFHLDMPALCAATTTTVATTTPATTTTTSEASEPTSEARGPATSSKFVDTIVESPTPRGDKLSTWILVTVAVAAVIVIAVVILILCVIYRYTQRQSGGIAKTTPVAHQGIFSKKEFQSTETLEYGIETALSSKISTLLLDDKYTLDRKHLTLGRQLGKGAFGVVHEGSLKGTKVAVKKLREVDGKETHVVKILEEARCMSEFDHPNVLGLIGVVVAEDGMPQLVTQFMDGGDLLTFLRTFSVASNDPGKSLPRGTMLNLAMQVAMGMKYLADRSFIHRDLAARNCMLSSDLLVRVGDFGLGRDVQEDSYYRVNSEWCLPVRWMAVESLQYYRFSIQSDVWSYGVLLHEIFTCGAAPYAGISNAEVMPHLIAGHRLSQPRLCPDQVYALMASCWAQVTSERPTFSAILTTLSSYDREVFTALLEGQAYANISTNSSHASVTKAKDGIGIGNCKTHCSESTSQSAQEVRASRIYENSDGFVEPATCRSATLSSDGSRVMYSQPD